MSELLTRVSAMIRYLTPPHELAERGLTERTAEKIYDLLLDIEAVLEDAGIEHESRELEPAEDEQGRPSSRKPPL